MGNKNSTITSQLTPPSANNDPVAKKECLKCESLKKELEIVIHNKETLLMRMELKKNMYKSIKEALENHISTISTDMQDMQQNMNRISLQVDQIRNLQVSDITTDINMTCFKRYGEECYVKGMYDLKAYIDNIILSE